MQVHCPGHLATLPDQGDMGVATLPDQGDMGCGTTLTAGQPFNHNHNQ